MSDRSSKAPPSELECFVLGLVWECGPCSPYQLRVRMAQSPSSQWSASAGAIYPLVRRLEARRLLASKAVSTGRRQGREYRVTAAGLRQLERWLGPPLPAAAVTVSYDPLRSRARFLRLLDHEQRLAWIAEARRALDQVAARVEAWDHEFASGGDAFLACLTRSGEIDVESRRRWLVVLERASGSSVELLGRSVQ